jgi:hypothetical protein
MAAIYGNTDWNPHLIRNSGLGYVSRDRSTPKVRSPYTACGLSWL